jgi:hypothetical protein
LLPRRRVLAVLLAVSSLTLSLANRQFHWLAHDGVSAQAYSTKVLNQRFALDGHHWALPVVSYVFCPSYCARVIPALRTPIRPSHPDTSLYTRPPPAS